jgi:hypothetical protein
MILTRRTSWTLIFKQIESGRKYENIRIYQGICCVIVKCRRLSEVLMSLERIDPKKI